MQNILSDLAIGSLEIFSKAAELKSFKRAATSLGLTPASISRSIGRLEDKLGVLLFERNTRHVSLTPEGEQFRTACASIISILAEAERNLSLQNNSAKGNLRITVGAVFAKYRLVEITSVFHELHPGINIELNISNSLVNMQDDSFDVAIRIGNQREPGLMYKPIEVAPLGLYASRSYIEEYGTPTTLAHLIDHKCIQFILPSSGKALPWLLNYDGIQNNEYAYLSSIKISDNPMACIDVALAGGGIVQTYEFVANQYVTSGSLVSVLPQFSGSMRTFNLVYKPNRYFSKRIRLFIDFMNEYPLFQ